jgi:hypothetical protein
MRSTPNRSVDLLALIRSIDRSGGHPLAAKLWIVTATTFAASSKGYTATHYATLAKRNQKNEVRLFFLLSVI